MSKPTVSFNGSDLASSVTGLIIISTDPYRAPNRDLAIGKIANTEKSVTSAAFFRDKKINVGVTIGRDTRELFEASLDQLNALLQVREAALVLSYGSATRQWTATMSNVAVSEIYGGYATLNIEFQCSDPIGKDTSSTSLFSESLTGANKTHSFTIGGTAYWQQPIITITYSALTGGTAKNVVIGNAATGQQLTITRDWAAADVLEIDSQAKTVKVNGVEVAFTGAIPEWNPGSGSMDYSDTLTTRTRTISAIYYKRYM